MKGQKILSCVVSQSTLKQLQMKLFDEGFALGKLLEVAYPDVDAMLSAVGKIKFLLEDHCVGICNQWVTIHVMVGDKKKSVPNRLVREVSISLLFCFYCALYAFAQFFLSCLGDITGYP
jgi:hypothetical protein